MVKDLMLRRMLLRPIGLASVALVAACADAGVLEGPDEVKREGSITVQEVGRIKVENDPAALRGRTHLTSEPLAIVPVGPAATAPRSPSDESFSLVLVAEIDPPEVDGTSLQASHSIIKGNKAYVAYNVQGPVRKGGVDVFDVSQPDAVELVSSALFEDTDVSAIDNHGSSALYLVAATDDPAFATPAVLEVVDLQGGKLTTTSTRIDLPSYVGTGVRVKGDRVYVTSGTGGDPVGGLSIFERRTLELAAFDAFEDARAVDVKGDLVVAMRGTSGELRLYEKQSGGLFQTYATGGANIPESKSTVFVSDGCAFYAAGDEGLRVVELGSGAAVVTLPVPDIDGVAPEDEVTNGASASGNLLFIANGGAGLFVALATHSLGSSSGTVAENDDDDGIGRGEGVSAISSCACSSADFGLEIIGQVQFPDGPSANYVDSKGNLLFVANGRGGLSIVRIDRSDG